MSATRKVEPRTPPTKEQAIAALRKYGQDIYNKFCKGVRCADCSMQIDDGCRLSSVSNAISELVNTLQLSYVLRTPPGEIALDEELSDRLIESEMEEARLDHMAEEIRVEGAEDESVHYTVSDEIRNHPLTLQEMNDLIDNADAVELSERDRRELDRIGQEILDSLPTANFADPGSLDDDIIERLHDLRLDLDRLGREQMERDDRAVAEALHDAYNG